MVYRVYRKIRETYGLGTRDLGTRKIEMKSNIFIEINMFFCKSVFSSP